MFKRTTLFTLSVIAWTAFMMAAQAAPRPKQVKIPLDHLETWHAALQRICHSPDQSEDARSTACVIARTMSKNYFDDPKDFGPVDASGIPERWL